MLACRPRSSSRFFVSWEKTRTDSQFVGTNKAVQICEDYLDPGRIGLLESEPKESLANRCSPAGIGLCETLVQDPLP
jgi:hypothetical protein